MRKILVINGPNLNMLGKRPKEHYGSLTLDQINQRMLQEAEGSLELSFFQSNSEGDIVTVIQQNLMVDGIIINPAAYTHTSVAIRDALELFKGPILEVHLSEVDCREDFRKINFIRPICTKSFCGKQVDSYLEAIQYLKSMK